MRLCMIAHPDLPLLFLPQALQSLPARRRGGDATAAVHTGWWLPVLLHSAAACR